MQTSKRTKAQSLRGSSQLPRAQSDCAERSGFSNTLLAIHSGQSGYAADFSNVVQLINKQTAFCPGFAIGYKLIIAVECGCTELLAMFLSFRFRATCGMCIWDL